MHKVPKGVIVVAVIIVVTVAVYLREVAKVLQAWRPEAVPATEVAMQKPKEVSAVVTYEVPGEKFDTLRFVVKLDDAGAIDEVRTLDAETDEIPEKKKEFNDQVNVILKGKKLSELAKIDKVGKSTLTTSAFNEVLDKLKAQL
jgi:hypothetical protein